MRPDFAFHTAARRMLLAGGLLGFAATPLAAQTYDCTFESGAGHVFEGGSFKPQGAGRLAFGIADVDMEAQTARLVTDRGQGGLRIVQALGATHFIEVATEGYLNLTTLYEKDEASGVYPAVHSRHSGVLGQPIVAQLVGGCKTKT